MVKTQMVIGHRIPRSAVGEFLSELAVPIYAEDLMEDDGEFSCGEYALLDSLAEALAPLYARKKGEGENGAL